MSSVGILLRVANIVCHLLLLAIVEPIFFFEFAGKHEIEVHKERVDKLKQRIDSFIKEHSLTLEQKTSLSQLLNQFNFESIIIDEKKLTNKSILFRNQTNQQLLYFSIYIAIGIFIILIIISYFAYITHINIPWKMLIFENVIILIGICAYEFYFYYHVASKFRSSSTSEDLYLYSNEIYNQLVKKNMY